ncbi:unnamed protein product [Paramecium sonneborni]|uniref:RING-type domain-containing protein n=1 Tax=Paramecium sonneborni TaxID=65129 RepID=A0A8S1KIN6_9CILI|nr:unnamed protein product [Paramecium sonneborni]
MDVIDLGKQSQWNIDFIIQEAFKPYQQMNTSSYIKVTYQCIKLNIPINFLINPNFIQKEIILQKFNTQPQLKFLNQNQHVIPFLENFYFESQEHLFFLFSLFLRFLYTGKINYRIKEDYLPLLKIAIYFQCDIFINCLIIQVKTSGITRNFFLNFLVDIFSDQSYFQVLLSNKNENALKFLEQMILANGPIMMGHLEWHNYNKKDAQDKIQISFKQVTVKLFEEIAKIYTKFYQQNVIHLTAFLSFMDKYKNPQIEIMEDIYLGRVFQFVDESFIQQNSNWLTTRCKNLLEQTLKKIESPPYHLMHSKACDLVNKSFRATCSHQICLNCFYQYLIYRSKFKYYHQYSQSFNQNNPLQNQNKKQKIRCFSRAIDQNLCDGCFQDEDFLQLKEYQINDLLNIYLQKQI